MINVCCMYGMFDILTDFDEDSISRSFVGNETEIMELLNVCNECSNIVPDIIQFDSEEENYYVFSLDNIDGNIYYSILPAINEKNGKFYGCNGDLFVSTTVAFSISFSPMIPFTVDTVVFVFIMPSSKVLFVIIAVSTLYIVLL